MTWRALALVAALAVACALPVAIPEAAPSNRRFLSTSSAPLTGPHTFERCAGVADHLGISAMDFNPEPVRPNHDLVVAVNGTLDRSLGGGVVKLTISYYTVPLTVLTLDLCKQFGISCPQKGGTPFRGVITYNVPTVPLSDVTVDVQIDVSDKQGKQISCIKTQVKVAGP
ncbi:hypothetical protein T492DRAFT_1059951 [Pavlovales sp. CCMP2436]|nr:hypothetical protein T492DRAFT_1059951 [Pavlovales sp. CCMP2436]|mmetsp:Transcript_9611/g.25368  ORF Transcript_9611/g.25368 Transcript_9611/m.25368 type:complete len:170 (+) Transcript_9611:67-576(+)